MSRHDRRRKPLRLSVLPLEDRVTPATLGDFVFRDVNGNGIQDDGAAGVGGVVVRLINNGTEVARTTTNATGYFGFETAGLPAGSGYWLQLLSIPTGYTLSPLDAGGNDNLDNDFYSTSAWTNYITLSPTVSNLSVDCGLVPTTPPPPPPPPFTLGVTGGTVNEGDEAAFTITLSAPQNASVSVGWNMDGLGTAQPGADFVPVGSAYAGTVVFAPGTTAVTVRVQTIGDTVADSGETMGLKATYAPGGTAGQTATAYVTITDVANPKPALRTAYPGVAEGNSGLTPLTFNLTLTAPATYPITVNYQTDPFTATAGTDFEAAGGSVTFAPGETVKPVAVNVIGDTTYEPNETFNLMLSSADSVAIIETRPVGTIINDDPLPTMTVSDTTVTEGNAGVVNATFTVTQSAPLPGGAYQYRYTITPGTATASVDFLAGTGTFNMPAGGTTATFSVPVYGDTFTEGDETFAVVITPVQGGANITDNTGVATILNDDPTSGTMKVPAVAWGTVRDTGANGSFETVATGPGPTISTQYFPPDYDQRAVFEFDVSRVIESDVQYVLFEYTSPNSPVAGAFPVAVYAYSGNGAIDLTDATGFTESGTGTVNDITTSRRSIRLNRDQLVAIAGQSNYVGLQLRVTSSSGFGNITTPFLTNPPAVDAATIAPALVFGTTTPAVPAVSVNSPSASEASPVGSAPRLTYTLSLSEPTVVPVRVRYDVFPGTATQGADYLNPGVGFVTFQPGQTTATVAVTVINDNIYEADETVLLALSNADGGTADPYAPGVGTILNDDPMPTISAQSVTVTEGDAGDTLATFTVTLSNPSAGTVAVSAGTSDDTARDNSDYRAAGGVLVFQPGVTSRTITVPVIGNTVAELTKRFFLNLVDASGATIATPQVTGTIVDNDPRPTVTPSGPLFVSEGAGFVDFTLTLSAPFGDPATVGFVTEDGLAVPGVDYVDADGSVTFLPGETTKTVRVPLLDDTHYEYAKDFYLKLRAFGGLSIGSTTTAHTFIESDDFPTVVLTPGPEVSEGTTITASATNLDPAPVSGQIGLYWSVYVAGGTTVIDGGEGPTFSWTPPDDGQYTLVLNAIDGTVNSNVGYTQVTRTLTATNVTPTPTIAGLPANPVEGSPIHLTVGVTDPGPADTTAGFTLAWNVTKNGAAVATGSSPTIDFTPADNGDYVVNVQATDADGGVGTTTATISVANVAPTPSIPGAPSQSPEGELIVLTGSVFDPGISDTVTRAWSVTKNGSPYRTGDDINFAFIPDDNGTYAVTLTATDKDGGVGTTTATITVTNVRPTPTISGPTTGTEGTPVTLTATATDPGTADTVTFDWVVVTTAGVYAAGSGPSFTFTPTDDGSYIVTLTATDDDGGSGQTQSTIAVANVAPTPTIIGIPASPVEGTAITLAATTTDPGISDTFSLAWAVTKNGTAYASGSGPGITFTPNDNGTYVVTLTATDNGGSSGSTSATLAVGNVNPTPTITGAPATVVEGTRVNLTGSATDPGAAEAVTFAWAVTKNGSAFASGSGSSFNFTPNDNGTYVVTLTATDKDGGTATASKSVTATNAAPTTSITGVPSAPKEGTAITLTSTVTDVGAADVAAGFTYAWTVTRNGTTVATGSGASLTFTPTDNGTYAVALTVRDKDGATGTASASLAVANVAPTAGLTAPGSGVRGQALAFTATGDDPAAADDAAGFTYTINWGDGSQQTVSGAAAGVPLTHAYAGTGTYTVTITARDKDGATSATSSRMVSVVAAQLVGGVLTVGGTTGGDTITLQPVDVNSGSGVTINVRVKVNGSTVGDFVPPSQIVVAGYAGNDSITLLDNRLGGTTYTIAARTFLFGDAGDDTLDGRGGSGAMVLSGGAGTDTITGGGGRNILLGGLGADTLRGGAGDDALIGGVTAFDTSLPQLDDLLDEWARTDASYATRVAHLRGTTGGGLNGGAVLTAATISDDGGAVDNLYGEGDTDWFVIDLNDRARDRTGSETQTNI